MGWEHVLWEKPLLPSWQASGDGTVLHPALALHVLRHLRVSELTEPCGLVASASSHCVGQKVGGSAILVQLRWQ